MGFAKKPKLGESVRSLFVFLKKPVAMFRKVAKLAAVTGGLRYSMSGRRAALRNSTSVRVGGRHPRRHQL